MKKAEKEYLNAIAQHGCIICRQPAEIHHVHYGMGKRASNYDTIPLCPYHHRQGNYGEAIHNGKKEFEKRYGTEQELLNKIKELKSK